MAWFVPLLAAVGGGSAATGGMLVASTALTAASAISQGNAAKAAGEANAKMQEQEASMARSQGNARQEAMRRRAREVLGQQRAAIGQAGIGWGGSAQDILEQSAVNMELDTMNIGYEAELQARGLINKSTMSRWEGKQAQRAGQVKAAGSILNSSVSYFGKG